MQDHICERYASSRCFVEHSYNWVDVGASVLLQKYVRFSFSGIQFSWHWFSESLPSQLFTKLSITQLWCSSKHAHLYSLVTPAIYSVDNSSPYHPVTQSGMTVLRPTKYDLGDLVRIKWIWTLKSADLSEIRFHLWIPPTIWYHVYGTCWAARSLKKPRSWPWIRLANAGWSSEKPVIGS